MAFFFLRRKRDATPGAKGRFDPVDAGKTIGAQTLLALRQEDLTAITLGRQKKPEEGLKK
jgi:hypothetical protein